MPLDEMPMGGLFTVGLIKDARRLVQIRRNRLLAMNERENSSYADMKTISDEINNARKLFTSQNWPVIDVSRRSVEETAAEIINLYNTWLENEGAS